MKNLNKRTEFEDKFREVFEEAGTSPPESIWDKIDAALSKGEAASMRKRAAWYKMLAAASIIFALGVGIFSINHILNTEQKEQVAAQKEEQLQQADADNKSSDEIDGIENELADEGGAGETVSGVLAAASPTPSQSSDMKKSSKSHDPAGGSYNIAQSTENKGKKAALFAGLGDQGESWLDLAFPSLASLGINEEDEGLVYSIDHIYYIPYIPKDAFKKNKQQNKKGPILLAGLGFSAGMFDPKFRDAASPATSGGVFYASSKLGAVSDRHTTFNTANKDFMEMRSAGDEVKPEFAYSYGANIGIRIINRIVIQTGFEYRKANSVIKTTGYLSSPEDGSNIPIVASYSYQQRGLSAVKSVSEISLDNQYEFAAIPVRLGYIVLDKRFNITVLAGMSPEFLLKNKIEDQSGFLETLTTGTGFDSPYKNVYFNGSVGTMLGYTIAGQYSVTVEPKYRFALNSFMKDDFYLNSYPASFMVSFGVSYNFK